MLKMKIETTMMMRSTYKANKKLVVPASHWRFKLWPDLKGLTDMLYNSYVTSDFSDEKMSGI